MKADNVAKLTRLAEVACVVLAIVAAVGALAINGCAP